MIAMNGYFSTLKKTCIELIMIVNGGSGGEPRVFFSGILNPPSPITTLKSLYHKFVFSIFDLIYPEK